ncbi:MAG: glycosyltransferase, partial [Bacteroidota bacterium]
MIPDNNADGILKAFEQIPSTKKLVIVGDVPYKDEYASALKQTNDPRILFTGYVRDAHALSALYSHCYAYLHGHEFGGTNPTLLKAMANRCAIAALDTVFSREVLQGERFGWYFEKNSSSIQSWFNWAEAHPAELEERRSQINQGITPKYTWEVVTDLYLYHLKTLVHPKVDTSEHDYIT